MRRSLKLLEPALKSLGDPFALPQMSTAVDRILEAIDKRKYSCLWGLRC